MQGKTQFLSSDYKLLTLNIWQCSSMKFHPELMVFPCLITIKFYSFWLSTLLQKFPNLQWFDQFQKWPCQYLSFPISFRPKYLEFRSKNLDDQSPRCWITTLFQRGPFSVSKVMNNPQEVQCMTQKLVDLVCHVGQQANTWQFFVLECQGPPFQISTHLEFVLSEKLTG